MQNKKYFSKSSVVFLLGLTIFNQQVFANRLKDPDAPITHCYHWINERTRGFLTYKYQYAKSNGGEITFFSDPTTSNGAAAGPGLYCAKTPVQSMTYGDRVIRIDLVDDVVLQAGGRKYCGHDGKFYANQAECDAKPIDINLYYPANGWYVITSPQAIASWSAYSDQLEKDLIAAKEDTNSSGVAQIDQTLTSMKSDAARLPKITFDNSKKRMDLLKVLADPKMVAQIPPLTLIGQIYINPKVTNKEKLIDVQFKRALADTLLTYSDFETAMKRGTDLQDIFKKVLSEAMKADSKNINIPVVLTAIDKLTSDNDGGAAKQAYVTKLWADLFNSKYNFDSMSSTDLRADGLVRKSFDKAVPSLQSFMNKGADEINAESILHVLNQFGSKQGSLKGHASYLLSEVLKRKSSYKASDLYNSLNNPALEKEAALQDLVVSELNGGKFKGMDPLAMGLLFDQISNKVSSQQKEDVQALIAKQPLVVTDRLSYFLLEDLKNKKLKVPSFMTENDVVAKLVERSIQERSLGKNTTNVYRMTLTGVYDFYVNRVTKAGADVPQAFYDQISKSLTDLAVKLQGSEKSAPYAYAALQNASLFKAKIHTEYHPMETFVSSMDLDVDKNIREIMVKSLDSSLLVYLLGATDNDADLKAKSKTLLKDMINYVSSAEFKTTIDSSGFQLGESDKRVWSNIIVKKGKSNYYSERAPSNLCGFVETYLKREGELKVIDPEGAKKASPVMLAVDKSECQKFRKKD